MLGDITVAENIYIACGHTDMRKLFLAEDVLFQTMQRKMPFVLLPSDGRTSCLPALRKALLLLSIVLLRPPKQINGLNVTKYLEYVLQFMSATDWRNNQEFPEEIMPDDISLKPGLLK